MSNDSEKIEIQNFISPGHVSRVNRSKYEAVRIAMLLVLPDSAPGFTIVEIKEKLLPLLPLDHFPGGDKAGWWMKAVQLDLEAKGIVLREKTKPLRFHQRR